MTKAPAPDASGDDGSVARHASDDHDDEHGHDAHGDVALGPVDVTAWGAGILGVLLGLAVAVAFVLATRPPQI